jgi:hypothetical protein
MVRICIMPAAIKPGYRSVQHAPSIQHVVVHGQGAAQLGETVAADTADGC